MQLGGGDEEVYFELSLKELEIGTMGEYCYFYMIISAVTHGLEDYSRTCSISFQRVAIPNSQ